MNAQLNTAIQSELSKGEKLLWSGQPKQGLIFRGYDLFLIPFSLVWASAFLFGFGGAVLNGSRDVLFTPFIVMGLLFLGVALYMIIGRFVLDILQRRSTYYAVTNERALIVSGASHRNVRSVNLKALPDLELTLKKDGRGTIVLGSQHPLAGMYGGMWLGFGRTPTPTLELIEDAKRVHAIIREAQRAS